MKRAAARITISIILVLALIPGCGDKQVTVKLDEQQQTDLQRNQELRDKMQQQMRQQMQQQMQQVQQNMPRPASPAQN